MGARQGRGDVLVTLTEGKYGRYWVEEDVYFLCARDRTYSTAFLFHRYSASRSPSVFCCYDFAFTLPSLFSSSLLFLFFSFSAPPSWSLLFVSASVWFLSLFSLHSFSLFLVHFLISSFPLSLFPFSYFLIFAFAFPFSFFFFLGLRKAQAELRRPPQLCLCDGLGQTIGCRRPTFPVAPFSVSLFGFIFIYFLPLLVYGSFLSCLVI